MRNNLKKLLVFSISVALLLASFLPGLSLAAEANSSSRLAVLEEVLGSVTLTRSGGKKEFKAVEGMTLNQGDTIKTGADSFARISFQDGSEASMSSNSQVTITELNNKDGGNQRSIRVVAGNVWNKVKSLVNANDSYNVETPTAIMGVRGTLFYTSVDPSVGRASQLSVMQGLVATGPVGTQMNPPNIIRQHNIIPSQSAPVGSGESTTIDFNNIDPNNFIGTASPDILGKIISAPSQIDIEEFVKNTEDTMLGQIVSDVLEEAIEKNEAAERSNEQFLREGKLTDIEQALKQNAISGQLERLSSELNREIVQQKRDELVDRLLEQRNRQVLQAQEQRRIQLQQAQQRQQEVLIQQARQAGLEEQRINQIREQAQNPRLTVPTPTPPTLTPPAPTQPAPTQPATTEPTPTNPSPGNGGGQPIDPNPTDPVDPVEPGDGNPTDPGEGPTQDKPVELYVDNTNGKLYVKGYNLENVYAFQIHIGHNVPELQHVNIDYSGNLYFPESLLAHEVNLLNPVEVNGHNELIFVQTLYNTTQGYTHTGLRDIVLINILPSYMQGSFWLNKVLVIDHNGNVIYSYVKQ